MLVTNDKGNMEKAKADGLFAKTSMPSIIITFDFIVNCVFIQIVQEYVELLSDVHPILVDILVDPSAALADDDDKKQGINFPEYMSSTQMNEGLKVCSFFLIILIGVF